MAISRQSFFKDTIACLNGLLARRSFTNPRSFLLSSSTIVCVNETVNKQYGFHATPKMTTMDSYPLQMVP